VKRLLRELAFVVGLATVAALMLAQWLCEKRCPL
jgi:hypothetical protein